MIFGWLNAKLPSDTSRLQQSPQFHAGKFQNFKQHKRKGKSAVFSFIRRLLKDHKTDPRPVKSMPVCNINKAELFLLDDSNIHIFRLGHSSILLKLGCDFWLIDPVFSKRASPFSFIGPKRFHQPPISIEQLPPIKGVIISHNHYDHLDKASIKALCKKVDYFMAPLGVDGDLVRWGVRPSQITTFDWWQQLQLDDLTLTFTPAHHYSGRGLDDNSSTLWGSWVIQYNNQKIFFSGDSGYFEGFKSIGEKHGPFDVCLIESGAYDANWPFVHMQPAQSMQAFIDLQGKQLMPIHNATFDLAFHPWYEPLDRLTELAKAAAIDILVPKFGQVITVGQPPQSEQWWKELN